MKLIQYVYPDRRILYCGDTITFELRINAEIKGTAYLRSNINKSLEYYREITDSLENRKEQSGNDWYDIPMKFSGDKRYSLTIALTEPGVFSAKIWFLKEGEHNPLWAEGDNITFKVEAARNVGANMLYSLFVRQFGQNMNKMQSDDKHEQTIRRLDEEGYTVIPPSGTFRSVIQHLDFIIGVLNSRIIQLLPIHPTPTVYGRMGRFGSAFASLDYFSVDAALAEFDKKTTPLGQFIELVDAVHARGARIFMDIPVNHTGWASCLHSQHPDWFVKDKDDGFVSPGAWGIVWSDLSQLDYSNPEVYRYMAEVFLYWLRLGVDGFRCDAGYKLPFEAWEYINAKIRMEYPEAVLLLEGLGGLLEKQEELLKSKGLNWAYSELFQNYDRVQIENYFNYCNRINNEAGLMIHYAETHDNNRLASVTPSYAKMRITLSAMLSYNGSFGITNGVEWLAREKVDVHGASALNWGAATNLVDYIRRLQTLLVSNPLFYHQAKIRFVNKGQDNTLVFLREIAGVKLLVAINLNGDSEAEALWDEKDFSAENLKAYDLLSGVSLVFNKREHLLFTKLSAYQALCLTSDETALKDLERRIVSKKYIHTDEPWQRQYLKAQILKIYQEYNNYILPQDFDIESFIDTLSKNPRLFWQKISNKMIPPLTRWRPYRDNKRIVPLPQNDLLLIESSLPFKAEIKKGDTTKESVNGFALNGKYYGIFSRIDDKLTQAQSYRINIVVFEKERANRMSGELLLLPADSQSQFKNSFTRRQITENNVYTIASNDLGGMSQIRASWGYLHSKYDAILAANCHDAYPVDRRVMFTRCRAWLVHNDYSQEINISFLESFTAETDNTAQWQFNLSVGQGKTVNLNIRFEMSPHDNAVRFIFERPAAPSNRQNPLEDDIPVKLILRPDIEDRINHETTKAYLGAENHFPQAVEAVDGRFVFMPDKNRRLKICVENSRFVMQPEWRYMVFYKEENERGLEDHGDLFSPGYFEFYLQGGEKNILTALVYNPTLDMPKENRFPLPQEGIESANTIEKSMREAMRRFIVKRDRFKTVIAGYPWFLDWGRDTLIALRGMISAGFLTESRDIILQFASFEENGTIPNVIRGGGVSNRETSDAPLWLFIAVEDYIAAKGDDKILREKCGERNLMQVLDSILSYYRDGTSNGIKTDEESGLVFSPAHYTWMDTNYPAGTPREGYPIEIQVFWASALRFMSRYASQWKVLFEKVTTSIEKYFWLEDKNCLADCLHAGPGQKASDSVAGDAIRPNQLFAVTLDILIEKDKKIAVINACEQLLIPGAIRTLADEEVKMLLPIYRDGMLLNDPKRPYWGRYEGDEDMRRKAAYHNGTAWTWPFPSYCEALYKVCGVSARERALSLLLSAKTIVEKGCIGQIPEILDGDSPHQLRGCGAQAWGVTEFYRVYHILSGKDES